MTLEEIKAAVLAGKRVCLTSKNYEVVHDSIGQWLVKCILDDYCIGLTWTDGKTLNGRPEDFFIDEAKKSVHEILCDAAEALRDHGHGCVTTSLFWDCECRTNFRKEAELRSCPICGASKCEQPDSALCEVLDVLAEAYA